MDTQTKIKSIVLICLIFISGFFVYFLISALNNYVAGVKGADAFKEEVNIEMITITAGDGADIHAFFMCTLENWEKTDHSIPFVITCHGMSNGPFNLKDVAYTFAKRGFAVLMPECRGHEASSATFTFGSKEPWDIISLMDYIEQNDDYNCVDLTNSGIIGCSLGGLIGMSTYIFESMGKHRLRAGAFGAGPLNVSRAVDAYTSTPEALGDTAFLGNLTGERGDKNPINYIDGTFPKNVLLRHGTEDETVDFRCSQDFYKKLNPNGIRTDVRFDIKEGAGHEVAGNTETLKSMVSWVENHTIHSNKNSYTRVEDVEILNFKDFSTSNSYSFISNLQFMCVLLIFIIPYALYLVKPDLFETKKDREIQLLSKSENQKDNVRTPTKTDKLIVLGGFFIIQITLSLISFFLIKDDVLTEVLLPAIFNLGYVIILFYKKFPEDIKEWCKQSFNPKIGSIFVMSTIFSMIIYHIIPNVPSIKESMLFFGIRVIWLFPYVITMFCSAFISNVFLSRYLLAGLKFKKIRLLGPIFNGTLILSSVFIMLFWDLNGVLSVPQGGIGELPIVILVAFLLFIIFLLADYISQITEMTLKTMIIVPILLSLITALLVLSNYDIFYFF